MSMDAATQSILDDASDLGNLLEWNLHAYEQRASYGIPITDDLHQSIACTTERMFNLLTLLEHRDCQNPMISNVISDLRVRFYDTASRIAAARVCRISKKIDKVLARDADLSLGLNEVLREQLIAPKMILSQIGDMAGIIECEGKLKYIKRLEDEIFKIVDYG